ncbi:SDR family NAD(P)-dependent oxidoreductase [Vibrio lamellibrachiae]|uniref:SDR family NAD(P)-dependent oxidoreductase n=1 Tax=Vibrio lamellibrachiae TaxID=2910253 RepID=UPI003D119F52
MILITGASSGLGAALANLYGHEGASLTLTGRNQQRLDQVQAPLSDKVKTQVSDLCDPQSVTELFDSITETPSTVIHCAGSGYFGNIEQQEPIEIKKLLDNNVTSTILFLRELIKRYRDQKVKIVVVMSTAAQAGKASESTYCAAKWAVRGFIESLRLELKDSPMKIIAVYPGGMATNFWDLGDKERDTSSFMTATEAASMLKQALVNTEHGYISDITIARG